MTRRGGGGTASPSISGAPGAAQPQPRPWAAPRADSAANSPADPGGSGGAESGARPSSSSVFFSSRESEECDSATMMEGRGWGSDGGRVREGASGWESFTFSFEIIMIRS